MKKTQFHDAEIPFGTLEKFGLTKEMVEDLPEYTLDEIRDGRRSPVLPIHFDNTDGQTIYARTRFALIRTDNGQCDILFYPQLKTVDLSRFNADERKSLESKYAIVAMQSTADGGETQVFMQLDPGTNQILSVPTPVIGRNLQIVRDGYKLTDGEMNCLYKGMPITIMEDDELVTTGIDLTAPTGIRITDGDEKKWRDEQKRAFDRYNFGVNGCWVSDDDGNLNYVSEEEYSEEMWEEMRKKNSGIKQMSIKH